MSDPVEDGDLGDTLAALPDLPIPSAVEARIRAALANEAATRAAAGVRHELTGSLDPLAKPVRETAPLHEE